MEVNDFIRKRRIELGLMMQDVADAVGVSEATVSRWESGHIDNMRRDKIYALSQVLQVSPLVILGMRDYEEDEDKKEEDRIKRFTDAVSNMTESEQEELENYMKFIISKRK